jgi:hypothetical protein
MQVAVDSLEENRKFVAENGIFLAVKAVFGSNYI